MPFCQKKGVRRDGFGSKCQTEGRDPSRGCRAVVTRVEDPKTVIVGNLNVSKLEPLHTGSEGHFWRPRMSKSLLLNV